MKVLIFCIEISLEGAQLDTMKLFEDCSIYPWKQSHILKQAEHSTHFLQSVLRPCLNLSSSIENKALHHIDINY